MIPRVLTVAGSDSGGGAGIQADLKTFFAFNVWGFTAVTAITIQDTHGVHGAVGVPPEAVAAQIEAVAADIGVDAVKTGMLWSAPVVQAVAHAVRRLGLPNVVVDPVRFAKGGHPLVSDAGWEALCRDLLPLATVVTPNLEEAALLAGLARDEIGGRAGMREAARRIRDLGPRWVLVKGGHLPAGELAVDLLYDGHGFVELEGERLPARHVHGTGCTLAAALAAGLARGLDVPEAARRAKSYVAAGIRSRLALGGGWDLVNHWAGEMPGAGR